MTHSPNHAAAVVDVFTLAGDAHFANLSRLRDARAKLPPFDAEGHKLDAAIYAARQLWNAAMRCESELQHYARLLEAVENERARRA